MTRPRQVFDLRARQFCAIRSYLSTAAKHGKYFLEVLTTLTEDPSLAPRN